METRRWTNPTQPQTLYLAQFLLYFSAAFALLGLLLGAGGSLIPLVGGIAAYGIANEKKWGYVVGVGIAVLNLAFQAFVLFGSLRLLGNVNFLIGLMFDVALAVLLLHPQSRDYQKVWFR